MLKTCRRLLLAVLPIVFGATAIVSEARAQTAPGGFGASPISFGVRGGAIHQPKADLDGGGGFSVTRGYVEPGATYSFGPKGSAGFSVGYGYSAFDFSSGAFLSGQKPWGDVQDLRFNLPLRWGATENLQVFAAPSLRFDWESGADVGDGLTAGAILGASWKVSETLSIGPGAGIFSGLEESVDIFPILLIDWKFTDTLSLKTGSGLGASRGPGLTIDWQATDDWSFGIGSRYEKVRFRLDDDGPAPGGVGEEKSFPVFLTAAWSPSPDIALTAVAGAEFGGELSVETSSGATLASTDYDPTPFFGFAFRARF